MDALHRSERSGPLAGFAVGVEEILRAEGRTTLCVFALSSGKGSCGLTPKKLQAGTYNIVATFGGSLKFAGSYAKKVLIVVR